MQRWMKIVIATLLALMGGAAAMLSLTTLSDQYSEAIRDYPQESRSVFLSDIAQDDSESILEQLETRVTAAHGVIIREDSKFTNDDEASVNGYNIGVFGDAARHPHEVRLSAFGATILDAHCLSTLLQAESNKTLGLYQNRADMIADLPSVRYGTSLSVMQLSTLVERSGTVNGEYRIIGMSQSQYDSLITDISTVTGISAEHLQQPLHGSTTTDSLQRTISTCLLTASTVLLVVILVLAAYQQLDKFGTHIMLGWSRIGYAWSIFHHMVLWSLLAIPIIAVFLRWGTGSFPLTFQLILRSFEPGILVCALTMLAACIASSVFLTIRPVDAIRDRISKRGLMIVLIVMYCCSAGALVAGGYALDGPIQEVKHLSAVRTSWSAYRSLRLLYHESPGTNQSSFTRQSTEHFKETYTWYSSIAGKEGVYIANMTHYDEENLESWKTIYRVAPAQPFWQLDASPNYLTDQGFKLPNGIAKRASNGERIFLIPDTWTAQQRKAMEEYLRKDSEHNADWKGSITTTYMKQRNIGFVTYHPSVKLFTWNTDGSLPNWTTDPVILVCTPENMTPFEGENLSAVGLDNSMVKLSERAAARYTTHGYFARYHLEDNNPQYIPVDDFIAGLSKTVAQTIEFFGLAMMFLALLEVVLSIAICNIYASTYRSRVTVKRLLGYPLTEIFASAFATIAVVSVLSIIAAALLRSRAAILLTMMLMILQLAIFLINTRGTATKAITTMITQE